jgi:hypothetical protein
MPGFVAPTHRTDLIWAAVDFDGTLVETRPPDYALGDPLPGVREKLWQLYLNDYKIAIHSARPWSDYELIESWLNYWMLPWDKIILGKLLAKVYIDDRALNAREDSWLP